MKAIRADQEPTETMKLELRNVLPPRPDFSGRYEVSEFIRAHIDAYRAMLAAATTIDVVPVSELEALAASLDSEWRYANRQEMQHYSDAPVRRFHVGQMNGFGTARERLRALIAKHKHADEAKL